MPTYDSLVQENSEQEQQHEQKHQHQYQEQQQHCVREFYKTNIFRKTTTTMWTTKLMMSSQTHVKNTASIREIFSQKVPMAHPAAKQTTHLTLKRPFGNTSSESAQTTEASALATAQSTAKTATVKKINKQNKLQHKKQQQQHQHQKTENCSSNNKNIGSSSCNNSSTLEQRGQEQLPNIITTDPAAIRANATATSLHSAVVVAAANKAATTSPTIATKPSTLPSSAKDVENALNETQWPSVCFSSKGCPKQKCAHPHSQQQVKQNEQQQEKEEQQQQHSHGDANSQEYDEHKYEPQQGAPHHCKSASISRCQSNSNISGSSSNNRIVPQININVANITTTTTNNNIIIANTIATTTSIANIIGNGCSSNSNSIIITNPTIKHTTATTSGISSVTAATRATPAYAIGALLHLLLLLPVRQRRLGHVMQMESMLRALMFGCFVFIMSLQFQNVAASASMQPKHEPMFISRSETFKFVAGDTIVLPCEVANTEPYVVAWKRGIAILTAGSVKVTPDPRVRLVNGFNLQIRDAVPQDAGDYICQIATMEPREITHTVEILVPPRIHHMSSSGHLQVKKGSSVRIECSASGNPTPNVTWSRKNNILPNGEEKLHSHILSIENVDRHKGGVYICTANNGVGQPASSQVILHVLYPPEINVERPVVFSGEGHEAMLVCIVHGETQPEVIWFKDTMQLDTTERHIMENRGSRHTLIIRKVHPQDFGNYSCVAENQLGKSRKTLQLSGKPNVAVFNSPPISQYKDRYNISWTVESHAPIEEYKLSFRRLQQGQEVDNSIDSHGSSASSMSSSSMIQMYGGGGLGGSSGLGNMGRVHNYQLGGIGGGSLSSMGSIGGGYGSYGAGNVIHWGRNDWRDVVLPAIPISHHYTQGMSYMIRGLDPDQHYEATVQARNRYGWSDYSQSFVFSTSSNDNEMRDLSVTFYGSRSSRVHRECSILLTTLIIVYMRYFAI
ncbi:uncharacterized protein LOC106092858 isoform X2 [Stomoxys calcitrans]|uniref:uncharacterized protein LOC106092858 isoform X2 n=1 Tax=Stomoxys calcitrans TaxID=35570 RepID=UPI0027E2397F|nr:uncharacterized protein LOC106092858 isoform X2 [Stomoxys calcitrans]